MTRPRMRYHADGSIDFDFYRRRAARLRRFAQRRMVRYCLVLIANVVGAAGAVAERHLDEWRASTNGDRVTRMAASRLVRKGDHP